MVVGGAFSFDWGLVQPAVAKFTRVCTYDPSGTAWSDPAPQPQQTTAPTCLDRVSEIHRLLKNAGVPGPYVLVGFSIGALIGRLYNASYPAEVAGMVIVDHAFIDVESDAPSPPAVSPKSAQSKNTPSPLDSPPVLISSAPITLGLEDDRNFRRLSQQDRDLHAWAMSLNPARPSAETAAQCSAALEGASRGQPFPFDNKPLIVIRTENSLPAYQTLQAKLLRLSSNSKQTVAENSSHMVIVDEPGVIVASIRQAVDTVRNGTAFRKR
ncbi:MAG: alpha/beta hydrolase [Acidobacteriota bacterium]|nr:alpha/beta hydrolase [Acidobacteriota bacterium]